MCEMGIALYGNPPRFDPKAGPLLGLVEVEGGTSAYLIDRERGRCRLESLPGPDRDKWTGPAGVLLAARRGWWGCSIRLDRYPIPPEFPAAAEVDHRRDFKRPYLPRDLASCPTCGALVAISRRRKRSDPGYRLVTPSGPLARRARRLLEACGIPAGRCRGKGRMAGRGHADDCHGLLGGASETARDG